MPSHTDAPASSPMRRSRRSSSSVTATTQPPPSKPPSTDDLLKDLTLVAEAAKRAQVAVMVRDFEDCAIS
ncbi:hypothetical protein L249_1548 [Ophiocordyceps polyrhachis-furcata BCC 54312]|uniref:Uncharacterized protein n=1 Tax=Ophiocordyceps polyrhachis-furcata BCC 54312 TaxID=1330021 RepID=A0A367L3Y9_9HYPO|nr:hypothetical protein L249_1548 [Ophiocordyceps polyrhachis-furcata BCC 54312]